MGREYIDPRCVDVTKQFAGLIPTCSAFPDMCTLILQYAHTTVLLSRESANSIVRAHGIGAHTS